jgi:hypothetical protein
VPTVYPVDGEGWIVFSWRTGLGLMPTLLWVNGIPERPGSADWMRYLADQILGQTGLHPPRRVTAEAENGLGIGRCVYWFVGSAVETYTGEATGLWQPTAALTDGEGGLCPFDTGGLWHQRFTTDPPLTDHNGVIEYFHACDRPLSDWPDETLKRIVTGWGDAPTYATGRPPTTPITPRNHSNHSTSQAWLWEGRVREDARVPDRVAVQELCWTEGNKRRFHTWLARYAGFSPDQRQRVLGVTRIASRVVTNIYPEVTTRLLSLAAAP